MNWNKLQPERPEGDQRTHVDKPDALFNVYDRKNIISQIVLYNATFMDLWPTMVRIHDLHANLFFDFPHVTKRSMGQTVVQSLKYNPRKLKGKTSNNPKACMTYVIPDPLALRYGLEWQICMWLYHTIDPEDRNIDEVNEILGEIGALESDELPEWIDQNVLDEYIAKRIPHWVDWPTLWAEKGWENETPEQAAPKRRLGERPSLDDLCSSPMLDGSIC